MSCASTSLSCRRPVALFAVTYANPGGTEAAASSSAVRLSFPQVGWPFVGIPPWSHALPAPKDPKWKPDTSASAVLASQRPMFTALASASFVLTTALCGSALLPVGFMIAALPRLQALGMPLTSFSMPVGTAVSLTGAGHPPTASGPSSTAALVSGTSGASRATASCGGWCCCRAASSDCFAAAQLAGGLGMKFLLALAPFAPAFSSLPMVSSPFTPFTLTFPSCAAALGSAPLRDVLPPRPLPPRPPRPPRPFCRPLSL
mmetsp:Transcript_5901/g.22905  ORF Transcript_5901/g.22905 Transcript_5901/m.22905 type:complete len:260 (-) Transcript_5901:423-1202(-)